MRVIYLASKRPDYQSSQLWRGLNEVLGIGNVLDAHSLDGGWPYYLHADMSRPFGENGNVACERIGQFEGSDRISSRFVWQSISNPPADGSLDADLIVVNYSSWKDTGSWITANAMLRKFQPGYKLAYICGDDHQGPYPDPPLCEGPVIKFQRELAPDDTSAIPLKWCAPEDWACSSTERPIDFVFCGAVNNAEREAVAEHMGYLAYRGHNVLLAAGDHVLAWRDYMEVLRRSKFAFCPVGAANCKETMRHYEAMASGCASIRLLDGPEFQIKNYDPLSPSAVVKTFLEKHTTRVRATELLRACGFDL